VSLNLECFQLTVGKADLETLRVLPRATISSPLSEAESLFVSPAPNQDVDVVTREPLQKTPSIRMPNSPSPLIDGGSLFVSPAPTQNDGVETHEPVGRGVSRTGWYCLPQVSSHVCSHALPH
jgi:hypothetical protein